MKTPYDSSPATSYIAVKQVIKAMGGLEVVCNGHEWLVIFPDEKSMNDAAVLIEMLKGWKVVEVPHTPNKVKIISRS